MMQKIPQIIDKIFSSKSPLAKALYRTDIQRDNIVAVDIQNVVDWTREHYSRKEIDLSKEFERVVSPFENALFEWYEREPNDTITTTIALVQRDFDQTEIENKAVIEQIIHFFYFNDSTWGKDKGRYIFSIVVNYLKDTGNLYDLTVWAINDNDELEPFTHQELTTHHFTDIANVLFAIQFMHTKSVTIRDKQVPRHERRAIERKEKKGGKPFVRYKVLDIEPMKVILATEGNVQSNGAVKAFHLCRGHYRFYSKTEKFVWIKEHWRGSKEVGEIKKSYNVLPPESGKI